MRFMLGSKIRDHSQAQEGTLIIEDIKEYLTT